MVELTGTGFVGGAAFDGDALLRGFRSLQSEPHGWNAIVQPALLARDVVTRASDTRLTLTAGDFAGYDISAPETVSLRVPGELLLAGRPIVAATSIVVFATPGTLSAALVGDGSDRGLRPLGGLLVLELEDDAWASDIGHHYRDPSRARWCRRRRRASSSRASCALGRARAGTKS